MECYVFYLIWNVLVKFKVISFFYCFGGLYRVGGIRGVLWGGL